MTKTCPRCIGDGQIQVGRPCPDCGGTGALPDDWKPKPIRDGQGFNFGTRKRGQRARKA